MTVYPIAPSKPVTSPTTCGQVPVVGTMPLAMARPTSVAAAENQNSVV